MGRRLRTEDELFLASRTWPSTATARASVVLVHGFSASKDDPAVVAVAERLADAGFDVLSYDARGHGESDGLCTLGDHERHDVAAAVAEARCHAERVVLVGASMGAIAVLRHAAGDHLVTGVVTVSSPAQWRMPRTLRALLAAGITQTPPGRWLAARYLRVRLAQGWTKPEPPADLAARISAPLAVVHGADDRFIPAADAALLVERAAGPRRVSIVPGMGHAFDAVGTDAIVDAVEWVLAHHPAPA